MAWVKILKPDYLLGHEVGSVVPVEFSPQQLATLIEYGAVEEAEGPKEEGGAYPKSFPPQLRSLLEEAGYASLDEVKSVSEEAFKASIVPTYTPEAQTLEPEIAPPNAAPVTPE